ncbi:MAG: hypothetical protein IPF99_29700 [Deltaproteobacteria bacterium]|nr:hypothetical protein [Deltaproteobacteria bacterium]
MKSSAPPPAPISPTARWRLSSRARSASSSGSAGESSGCSRSIRSKTRWLPSRRAMPSCPVSKRASATARPSEVGAQYQSTAPE